MLGAKSMQCVNVCSIVNPYLFWFTYNDEATINNRELLEKGLEELHQYEFPSSRSKFSKGQLVVVKHNNTWKRATIEDILEIESTKKYICWLIDHGILFESDVVFKCFHRCDDPPYAKQAAINNIVFVEQKMDITNNSIKLQKSKSSTPAIHILIDEKITNNKTLFFAEENSCMDILFGDIYYVDNGMMKSLRNTLVNQKLAVIDPKGFEEGFSFEWVQNKSNYLSPLKHSAPDDKEISDNTHKHREFAPTVPNFDLRELENDLNGVQGTFRKSRRGISCNKNKDKKSLNYPVLQNKVVETKENINSGNVMDPNEIKKKRQELLLKRHKNNKLELKKENQKSIVVDQKNDVFEKSTQPVATKSIPENQNKSPSNKQTSQSEESVVCDTGANKITNNSAEGKVKNKFLHELFEKRKKRYQKYASKEQDTLDSESDFEKSNTGSADLTSDIDEVISTTDVTDGEDKQRAPKHVSSIHGLSFTPAGASYSMANRKTSKKTKKLCKKSTDEDVSEANSQENGDPKNCQVTEPRQSGVEETNEVDEGTNRVAEKTNGVAEPELEQSANHKQESTRCTVAPSCKCKDCDFYTNSAAWNIDYVSERRTKEIDVNICAPRLLKENKTEVVAANVKLVNYKHLSKIEKLQLPKQIIHGTIIPRELRHLSEASFELEIHTALKKLEYKTCKKLQMYTLPAVLKSMNVCMVNGPHTGKTLGYLPPLCSFLLERGERYADVIKNKGPIVLILCPNSKQCENVYDLMRVMFLGITHRRPRVLAAIYPLKGVKFADAEVLITMPVVLATLMKAHVITLKRMCHLVLEDADVLLTKYKELVDQILDVTQSMLDHRHCDLGVQLIATCSRWTLDVERVMKNLTSFPLICIGDYLEAIMYSRVKLYLQFVTRNEKIFSLLEIVREKYKMYKTLVICNCEDFEEVVSSLRQQGLDLVAIPENMQEEEMMSSENQWNALHRGQYSVLVCTDDTLNSVLTITDARCLIHYSLPNTYSVFARRLATFSESLKCPLAVNENNDLSHCHVLTDENCIAQIPRFLGFLQRMKSTLPAEFQEYLQQQEYLKEEKQLANKIKVCENIKQFGVCGLGNKCTNRHFLNSQLDVCENLPQNGRLKFKIINMEGLTKFTVQIMQHVDVNNIVQEWSMVVPDEVERELTKKMPHKKVPAKKPEIGNWYAFRANTATGEMYHRCQVCDKCVDGTFIVKMLDRRENRNALPRDLFELPEHFKSMPLKLCHVYLSNFAPPFCDDRFSKRAIRKLKELLESVNYFNIVMSGDIFLQLGNCIWLKDVVYEVSVGDQVVTKLNITQKLKEMGLVQMNEKHLTNLYKLCEDAKISLPKYVSSRQSKTKQHEEQTKPQWAFMDSDKIYEVVFAAAVSPSEAFFRQTKFEELLKRLQQEIQEVVQNPLYDKQFRVKVGKCYLAKDPDGSEYCRVQVIKTKDQKALCFYVDHGDEGVVNVTDLRYIPNHIISKLPFQSIRCRLYGLTPVGETWLEAATDMLYSYAYEPDSNIFRRLYLKTCVVEKMGIVRKKYAVLLKEGYSQKQVLINKLLLDCGMAKWAVSEPIVDFDLPKPAFDDESDPDSDLEDIADIVKTTNKVSNTEFQRADLPQNDELNLDDIDFYMFEKGSFLRQLTGADGPKGHAGGNNQLPAIEAPEAVDYYTPDVVWSESETHVKLHIKVPNLVGDYQVKLVKDQYMTFKANVNGKQYSLKLVLFDKVETCYQHTYVGQEVRIFFTKVNTNSWPRLLSSNKRMRNISYDLSTLKIEDEKERRLLDLGDIESESDGAADDDLKYMEVSDVSSSSDYFEVESD